MTSDDDTLKPCPPVPAEHVVVDEDAPGPPISLPDSADTGEGGKIKMIVQLVRKCLGVKDIAAMRLSLPASLLEPIPNLEYWQYLDRPDLFAAINDYADPLDRMVAVLRFTFTKELKFVKGKVCKPYNSVLGEHFRAHWDFVPFSSSPPSSPTSESPTIPGTLTSISPRSSLVRSEAGSLKSGKSSKSSSGLSVAGKSPSTAPTSLASDLGGAEMSNLSLAVAGADDDDREMDDAPIRVVYVTEQVSHHPPVSAYYATCPARSLELRGIDQIAAKVSGTTLRVAPGQFNKGLFVSIGSGHGEGETYHITHPIASVNGILRGSFYVTLGDSTIITCSGGKHHDSETRYRTVVEYKEESWLGRAHYLVEGVIHTYTEGESTHEEWTKVKHVPHARVVAVFDGSWRGHIRWRRVAGAPASLPASAASSVAASTRHSDAGTPSSGSTLSLPSVAARRISLSTNALSSSSSSALPSSISTSICTSAGGEYTTLIDLAALDVVPKAVRPLERQLPHESRRLWEGVTSRLLRKEFGDATREKHRIEQIQRDEALERKRRGIEFFPRYFERDISAGFAALTAEGREAVEEELNEDKSSCIEAVC